MKKHDKDNDNLAKPAKPEPKASQPEKPSPSVQQEKPVSTLSFMCCGLLKIPDVLMSN